VLLPGAIGVVVVSGGPDVVLGTVTVTGLVLVVGGVVVDGLLVVTGASVVVVVGCVVVVVDDVVVDADADWITPQATRLPESPVDIVSSSGPVALFFCW
jgi:hypothetical protein